MRFRPSVVLCLAVVVASCIPLTVSAAIEVLDASYRPDRVPAGFEIFWKDGYRWGDTYTSYTPSGALAIYVRNTGGSSVTISDLLVNGASLANGFYCSTSEYRCALACGTSTNTTLANAGEPVWWRVGPSTVDPDGTAELFVRMRTRVATTLSLTIQTSAGNVATSIVVDSSDRPRIAGYGLSPDSTQLYLYLRHPQKGKLPTQILVDGVDKTSSCVMGGDSSYDLVAVKCTLSSAFARGSFHCFQAIYNDGSKAADGLRVFSDDFKYGRWGGPPSSDDADALFHIRDMGVHSMNMQVIGWGGLNNSAPGFTDIMDQYGIKRVHNGGSGDRCCGIFLCDEPDAGEDINVNIPKYCPAKVGALSNNLAAKSESFKASEPQYPTFVNLNGSFKPTNYYIYGHVMDVVGADPYYQTRIVDSYWTRPNTIPLYSKATYIYAVASMCQAACEPSPQHITLNSCRKHDSANARVFRWGTPEEKRIEVYYALAAGVKLISYWWFSNVGVNATGFCGISDANEPGSAALWREIGLLGAELGIASPVLVNSCPVSVDVTKPGKLWIRTLLSSTDTLVLLCVNDDYTNDDTGTIMRSIKNAEVSLGLPSWIASPTNVFEVDYKGVHDVPYDVASSRINFHLGRVEMTRMILITKDSSLKSALQSRYTDIYGPRVAELTPLP